MIGKLEDKIQLCDQPYSMTMKDVTVDDFIIEFTFEGYKWSVRFVWNCFSFTYERKKLLEVWQLDDCKDPIFTV